MSATGAIERYELLWSAMGSDVVWDRRS